MCPSCCLLLVLMIPVINLGPDSTWVLGGDLTTDLYSGNGTCSDPPICDCVFVNQILVADCSSREITPTTIPKMSDSVHTVLMASNKLTTLPENTDKFGINVRILNLRKNLMSSININAFKNLAGLEILDLSENRLMTSQNVLKKGVFQGLKNLQILYIHKNSVPGQKAVNYSDRAFADLTSLRNLSIDGQPDTDFGSGFKSLRNLHHLDFAGFGGDCHIRNLNKTTFQNVKYLQTINARHCHISGIGEGTFSGLTNLTHLLLSGNQHLEFKALRSISNDLVHTSIKVLELNKIHTTFGLGTMIYKDDIEGFYNTSLEVLSLDSNRLELFEMGVLSLMPESLVEVSLVDNKLTYGYFFYEIQNLKVQIFNGSLQFKSHNPGELSTPSFVSKEIHSHSCMRHCSQNEIIDENFHISICIPFPPDVKQIDFSSSDLHYDLTSLCFQKNSLKWLSLAHNTLYKWTGLIEGFEGLEYLDLSNNFCDEVRNRFFDSFPNLTHLRIQQNFIGFSLRLDYNGDIFKNLSNLKILEISDNRIDSLPIAIFRGLQNLERLHLNNNSLTLSEFSIQHMEKLQHIDVSFNRLTSLTGSILASLDKLYVSNTNISINLQGNPLECNCDTLEFVEWFQKRKSVFVLADEYSCNYFGHETKVYVTTINIREMRKKCTDYTGLIIGTIVCILIVTFIIIAGLVYRFRWKLRYAYYMARNRYLGYAPVPVENEDDGFIYDAFIAYSDNQRKFVVNDMMKHMETEAGLSLCIHHRDFLPGNEIGANITDAIHKSRRTVAIVSRDFLKSYWCMFELNMARMESIYSRDGRTNIFLVMYDNDIHRHLPLEFYDLIENESYIEFPDDPQGNVVFWNKMVEALSQKR